MTPSQLVAEALKLDHRDRADVANRLIQSLDTLSESAIETLWLEEAKRRDRSMDAGDAQSIPAATVVENIRSRLE